MPNVAVFVGSLRRDSINLHLAKALAKLAADQLTFELFDLSDVPLYNEDLWADPPAAVTRLKATIKAADAVLFVTPEYNRSMPAVTKNIVDWGTRPIGQNSWAGKPGAIVGASPGAIGTAVAQSHLRSVLVAIGVALFNGPEVYFQNKPGLISDGFEITDDKTRAFLSGFIAKFASHVERTQAH